MGGHDHNTGHKHHSHAEAPSWLLKLGLGINLSFFIADLIIWQISGSVAILADSTHNLFHGVIYLIALWGNSPTQQRKQAHASFCIGVIIILTALFIGTFGSIRIWKPEEIISKYMIIIASLDIALDVLMINLIFAVTHRSIRIYRIYLVKNILKDNIIDMLASVGVIVGGILILTIQYYRADGIAAIPIAIIAVWLGWQIIREALEELRLLKK